MGMMLLASQEIFSQTRNREIQVTLLTSELPQLKTTFIPKSWPFPGWVSVKMEWSATSATKAYLDTLHLCGDDKRQCDSSKTPEPGSTEFISALAAGMRAKLIVEVTSCVSQLTIALAAAARQTGGRLVCILPEKVLDESKKVIKDSGLNDIVEFKTGDPSEILPTYENIDFSLIDCKSDDYTKLLKLLGVNPRRSVVVANNLVGGQEGLGGHIRGINDNMVRSMKHPIGKGMEITMIGRTDAITKRDRSGGSYQGAEGSYTALKRTRTSRWIIKVDKENGEEHIFRVPRTQGPERAPKSLVPERVPQSI